MGVHRERQIARGVADLARVDICSLQPRKGLQGELRAIGTLQVRELDDEDFRVGAPTMLNSGVDSARSQPEAAPAEPVLARRLR